MQHDTFEQIRNAPGLVPFLTRIENTQDYEKALGMMDELIDSYDGTHEAPAIGAFLDLLARDIEAGRSIHGLPDDLTRAMLEYSGHAVSLADEIDGEVAF